MSTIPTIVVTPSSAAAAYAKVAGGGASDDASAETEGSFGATIQQAMRQAVQTGHAAEDQATQALKGGGNLTDVVVALSHAEMTLQTATVIRDRVLAAYTDIMKMPI